VSTSQGAEGAELRALTAAVEALHREVLAEAAAQLTRWRPAIERSEFLPAAENLAAFLALRRRDLTELQRELSRFGLSSLGRAAHRVLPNLEAVLVSLHELAGNAAPLPRPSAAQQRAGLERIRARATELFGPDPGGPSTRILVTLPESLAGKPQGCRQLLEAGADLARINGAHGDAHSWSALLEAWRGGAAALGRRAPVLLDLPGPKCRTLEVHGGRSRKLRRGDRFVLGRALPAAIEPGLRAAATLAFPELLAELAPGHRVYYDDGKLLARVLEVDRERALLEVLGAKSGGVRLRADKGLNYPDLELTLEPLGPDDLVALDFAVQQADLIGFSFVQRPEDVRRLQQELERRLAGAPLPPVVLKVETALAVRNLPRLLVQAGARQPVAVMVARGDLAVEVGFARLAEIQGQLLDLCRAAQVPVIWATQVFEGLVKRGWPTRAETTDASLAQSADCVMLNKGEHLLDGVRLLDDVLRRMDRHRESGAPRLPTLRSWAETQDLG
jgi:pyruvate kinase